MQFVKSERFKISHCHHVSKMNFPLFQVFLYFLSRISSRDKRRNVFAFINREREKMKSEVITLIPNLFSIILVPVRTMYRGH
jgi:hypothetical protein